MAAAQAQGVAGYLMRIIKNTITGRALLLHAMGHCDRCSLTSEGGVRGVRLAGMLTAAAF